MSAVAEWALALLAAYGFPILVGVAFFGSLGIPFPITMVIIAAGAFARLGILDWRLGMLACLIGASLADTSEFILGRLARGRLERRFNSSRLWQQALVILNHQGRWAILLTRFWLTSLAPAINILAGGRYPFWRFLLYDLTGQLLWVVLYGGAGYLFADRWNQVSQAVSSFTGISAGLVIAAWAAYNLVQRKKAPPAYTRNKPLHDSQRL